MTIANTPARAGPGVLPLAALFAANAVLQLAIYLALTPPALAAQGVTEGVGPLLVAWPAMIFGAAALLFSLATALGSRILGPRRVVSWLAICLAAATTSLVAMDCKVYSVLGLRMDDYFILASLSGGHFVREAQLGLATYASLGAALLACVALQVGLLRGFHYLSVSREQALRWSVVACTLALVLIGGLVTGLSLPSARASSHPALSALPLGNALIWPTESGGQTTVHHPALQAPAAHRVGKPKNVVLVLVESLRGDFATPEIMPELNRLAERPDCRLAANHHSGGHATAWGVFSYLYGLNSYHFLPFHKQNVPSLPLSLLKSQGYDLIGVSGSKLRGWDHSDFILDGFDTYREFTSKIGWKNDRDVLEWVEKKVQERDAGRPFVLFVFLVSPHHNYYYPPEFARHQPAMAENYNHFMDSDKLRAFKDQIVNRYRNSVLWTDHLIGRLLKTVGRPEDTVVAVSGDHGEEFWDHGLLGHGAPRFYNARTRVPLLLCAPGRQPQSHRISSHVDVWPTVLDALALDPPLPAAGWSDGVSLLQPEPLERSIVVTGVGFPAGSRTLALLNAGYKLWLQRDGALNRFKVIKRLMADDSEINDRPTPNEQLWLRQLGTRMRRFLRTRLAATTTEPPVQHRVDARFGDQVRLVGYNLEVRKPGPGGTAIVRWVFECLAPVPKEFRLFVHLGAGHATGFVNLDHVPADGTLPLARWRAGEFISDEHVIGLPKQVTPGARLSLTMGLWAPGAGRAKVKAKGFKVRNDALLVTTLEIR